MKSISKRGQGISINVIIVAAIALIVLVVLILIFTGRMGIFGAGIDDATSGKDCNEYKSASGQSAGWQSGNCDAETTPVYGKINDADQYPGSVCCVPKT